MEFYKNNFKKSATANATSIWGEILEKAKHYCAYQERCHADVQEKLNTYEISESQKGEIMAVLIENNYLNEERFAILFSGGHFRQKKWGKIKIQNALRARKIGDYIIAKALDAIDYDDYLHTLRQLSSKKWGEIKAANKYERMAKCRNFLLQKGYESGIIMQVLREISEE